MTMVVKASSKVAVTPLAPTMHGPTDRLMERLTHKDASIYVISVNKSSCLSKKLVKSLILVDEIVGSGW